MLGTQAEWMAKMRTLGLRGFQLPTSIDSCCCLTARVPDWVVVITPPVYMTGLQFITIYPWNVLCNTFGYWIPKNHIPTPSLSTTLFSSRLWWVLDQGMWPVGANARESAEFMSCVRINSLIGTINTRLAVWLSCSEEDTGLRFQHNILTNIYIYACNV